MAYRWATEEQIQNFLDSASTIVIGDNAAKNFPTVTAQQQENLATYDVEMFLAPGWEIPLPTGDIYLQLMAAKLTAAYIGTSRFGASFGNISTEVATRYKSEVWSALSRMIANQDSITIVGAIKKTMTLEQRLLAAKTREQAIIPRE